jgi:FKBP-type peptidyl-prolyl cis-trans isomerase FkpA
MLTDVKSTGSGRRRATASFGRIVLALGAIAVLGGCGEGSSSGRYAEAPSSNQENAAMAQSPITEMIVEDVAAGSGAAVAQGQKATVHYTGWLYSSDAPEKKGKQFDSSRTRGQPFSFSVGGGRVIRGWDQGVVGMKIGGERRLTIPASLGYGAGGAGGGLIPPNATLVFDIELLAID